MARVEDIQLYTPHAKQADVHADHSRFKLLNWGRRTGKSTFAQNYILHPAPNPAGYETKLGPHQGRPYWRINGRREYHWPIKGALEEIGRYWIVAPTYRQAKNIYWHGLMFSADPKVTTAIPKALIKDINNSELSIELINGSRIELKGADNPDSLRGTGVKGLVLDEYAFMDPTAWEYVLQPQLLDSRGWAVFISTPNGFNHFWELAEFAKGNRVVGGKVIVEHPHGRPSWGYHYATVYDNPHQSKDEINRLRSETDEDTFSQEYLAEFRKRQGLVYPEFSRNIHVYDHESPETVIGHSIPLGGTWALGLDPGTSNELAGVFVFIDYDNNWYITDEFYERGKDTAAVAQALFAKMGSNYYSIKVADSAAAQFITDMNALHNLGVSPIKKVADSIPMGIRLNKDLLRVQEGTGKPKLFVSSKCTNFINEIEMYHYPDKTDNHNPPELPVKEHDHLMDAWRYLRLAQHMPQTPPAPRRERRHDPVTGRIIGYVTESGEIY